MTSPQLAGQPAPVVALDEVDSTNTEALRRARAGARGPLWVTAQRQTGGRGRHSRPWASQAGNLYASLLLSDPAPLECCPQLSFVAGLALHAAAATLTGLAPPRMALKWPNDLLVDGAKCAGILVEGEFVQRGSSFAVVIGLGVNCVSHPEGLPYPAIDFAAAGCAVTPQALVAELDCAMAHLLAQWQAGVGFAAIREQWLKCASGVGGAVAVRTEQGVVTGIFEKLDEDGGLILQREDGSRLRVAAGDVLPLQPAPEARQ